MTRPCAVACAITCAVACGASLHGQASAQDQSGPATAKQVFRSRADLVALNVVVTDGAQKFVSGLAPHEFAVFEDGVAQDVTFFATRAVPIDVAILIDTSASMLDKMPVVQQAARGLLKTLRDGDRVMVVAIKGTTRVLFGLSPDLAAADAAIAAMEASGGTGLYNALYATHKELVKRRLPVDDGGDADVRRQAIVVLSDARDTSSLMSLDDVLDVAKASGIATYTVTLKSPDGFGLAPTESRVLEAPEYGMKTLAQETGARSFFPREVGELKDVYASIAADLAHQYALGYSPKNGRLDGAYRRIVVRVPDRPELRARTRGGYVPGRDLSSAP